MRDKNDSIDPQPREGRHENAKLDRVDWLWDVKLETRRERRRASILLPRVRGERTGPSRAAACARA
jgi:hypothetical protein